MVDLTRHLQDDEVAWCMLFVDDIVLIDETRNGVNTKLELWRDALESKGFKISRTKTKYMESKFSNNRNRDEVIVTIDGQEVQKRLLFRYLESIIEENEEIEEHVAHKIRVGWAKWRCATGILCDRRIPMRLKGKFYRSTVRPALLYGAKCWMDKKQYTYRMSVAKMRMLRWMIGKTRRDRVRNESI
ncbi:hypothetical protein AMTRI_Chr08g209200 [Amborella trichopoda]